METPRSCIVTPYRASAAETVLLSCVMMMNCESLTNCFQQVREAVRVFDSSSGASSSSSKQNGDGFTHVERKEQRHGGERLLAARQQRDTLELGARGLGHDLDAALQRILGLHQVDLGPAATKENVEGVGEVLADLLERDLELPSRTYLLMSSMAFRRSALAFVRSSLWVIEEVEALAEFGVFLDGHEDSPRPSHRCAGRKGVNLGLDFGPVGGIERCEVCFGRLALVLLLLAPLRLGLGNRGTGLTGNGSIRRQRRGLTLPAEG